ncbi:DUF3347 domain-containing protein [Nonlabens sp.]|uniref:DUF3347 domain-containing protein n=1 Tax=Nonlabens sp. TaxID=1888209 RepID=UPI003265AC9F
MKTIQSNLVKLALIATVIFTVSCKKTEENTSIEIGDKETTLVSSITSEKVLKNYFNLKDALVKDDKDKATIHSEYLSNSLNDFSNSISIEDKQDELKEILNDAVKNTNLISEKDIKIQREYFKELSKDITDMIAITGTEQPLYEQHCPMYNGGSNWLSNSKEIRNPYYGSQMLKCGIVQREIK